ncbi:MAG: hypothetical protein ACE5HK_05965 [Candidatus Methylomirabilales bacterium]
MNHDTLAIRYVIVLRERAHLLQYVERAFEEILNVRVIVDRRRGERRQAAAPVAFDRRVSTSDRRRRAAFTL